ncbi:hypothetical protein SeMB42_g03763 [Synchytrium endobioticum]|uniref:Uncharacterized protein n=1 Tax=Synchytrium endobioticum TaxID=286115 RepID=A0A507D4Y5_9FUNG|nr:hypothetical protein SeMB42_g03763 [Synchytrium endobioticum]
MLSGEGPEQGQSAPCRHRSDYLSIFSATLSQTMWRVTRQSVQPTILFGSGRKASYINNDIRNVILKPYCGTSALALVIQQLSVHHTMQKFEDNYPQPFYNMQGHDH